MALTKNQIGRYSRHLIMPEVGVKGQEKLAESKVLCIGAGGLGSPLALYLASAGIGTIGIVDFDVVDLSNLQRQILHAEDRVGELKVESAKKRLLELNSDINTANMQTLTLTSANDELGEVSTAGIFVPNYNSGKLDFYSWDETPKLLQTNPDFIRRHYEYVQNGMNNYAKVFPSIQKDDMTDFMGKMQEVTLMRENMQTRYDITQDEMKRVYSNVIDKLGINTIEFHTGSYANAFLSKHNVQLELEKIRESSSFAKKLGFNCHAGHGLTFDNVSSIASIKEIVELNIGHFIIGNSIFEGLENSIKKMRYIISKAVK